MSEIFTNWSENDFRYYLKHHGIMKQRWGVRHGPPYPLDYNAHTKAQKKANISKHNIGQEKYSGSEGKAFRKLARFANEPHELRGIDSVNREAIRVESKYGGDSGFYETSAYIADQLKNGNNPFECKKGFDGVYDEVNPDYGEKGTINNCPFVGAAMEIRSRGFDIVARRAENGAVATKFEDWFEGAETQYNASWRDLKADLRAAGDGASGVLQGFYGDGLGSGMGGHTLHWRNENGKTIVADGQNHSEMLFDEVRDKYHFGLGGCSHTRLDNCAINWDGIAKDGVVGVTNKETDYVHYDPDEYEDSRYLNDTRHVDRRWSRRDQGGTVYSRY